MSIEQQKNEVIEAIKFYCITTIDQLEYKPNISVHDVRKLLREDISFKNTVEEYMYQNKRKLIAKKQARHEELKRILENRRSHGLER